MTHGHGRWRRAAALWRAKPREPPPRTRSKSTKQTRMKRMWRVGGRSASKGRRESANRRCTPLTPARRQARTSDRSRTVGRIIAKTGPATWPPGRRNPSRFARANSPGKQTPKGCERSVHGGTDIRTVLGRVRWKFPKMLASFLKNNSVSSWVGLLWSTA